MLFFSGPPLWVTKWLINVTVKDYFVGGFDVAGLRVKVKISSDTDGILSEVLEFIVNDKGYDGTAKIEGGHEIKLLVGPELIDGRYVGDDGDVTGTRMELDGEIIVENGFVYVGKIEQIMSGSVAPSKSEPCAFDTGVMPPFQTMPSHGSAERTVAPRTKSYAIVGETGKFANHQFNISDMLVLGRDAAECSVAFPADTAGVSRVHCKLVVEADGLCVYDLGSTYGTVVNNNKTLSANQMMKLNHGDTITIGSNQTFVVKSM